MEGVLTSGLSTKLMRYLRIRVLGEISTSQKEANYLVESKSASTASCMRSRDESRSRFRQVSEASHMDPPRIVEEGSLDDAERDRNRSISRQVCGDERRVDFEEPPDVLANDVDSFEADVTGEERWHGRDLRDGKTKLGDRNSHGRSVREEDFDESRDDSSKRRANRGGARPKGKTRANESSVESELVLSSPVLGSRVGGQGRSTKDRSSTRNLEMKRIPDNKKPLGRIGADAMERDGNDDCFQECKVGSKDIRDLVKKAVRAAEAEARAANAPTEAIRAAGDSAAEVVKSAALEARITHSFYMTLHV